MNKIEIKLLLLVAISYAGAGELAFYVPTSNEKFGLIDSLCSYSETLDLQVKKTESALIRRDIRTDNLKTKCQFLKHRLKYGQVSIDEILSYFALMHNRQTVKTFYLKHLLQALQGDIRAQCYILWKSSRDKVLEIERYTEKFMATPASVIEYHQKCTLIVVEPERFISTSVEENYENPFDGAEMMVETIER